MVDWGMASKGIGLGIGMIGVGIGLRHLNETAKNVRNTKSKPYHPSFARKKYVPEQYGIKPIKWKL